MNISFFRLSRALVCACLSSAILPASARAQAVVPPAPDEGTIQLQFPNNGISDILGIYELLTGKRPFANIQEIDDRTAIFPILASWSRPSPSPPPRPWN